MWDRRANRSDPPAVALQVPLGRRVHLSVNHVFGVIEIDHLGHGVYGRCQMRQKADIHAYEFMPSRTNAEAFTSLLKMRPK